jgi:hypothetical protein
VRVRRRSPLAAWLAALVVAGALGASAHAARADDPFQTTIGISLNPVAGGYHESFDDVISLPPVPVPLLEASQRLGPFELAGYGLPPTVAIPYTDAIQGSTALRLTIFDASLRLWGPKHRIAIEAGETIYNQTTAYATADFYAGTDERQYSRIAGAHYGVVAHLPFRSGYFEIESRDAPVLLGTQVSTYGNGAPSRFDPERGEQIDEDVRFIRRAGTHSELVAGVRYVNFTAAYDVPGRPLSDRNCAVLPSIGYRFATGP